MLIHHFHQSNPDKIKANRLIMMAGVDAAPPSPENFTSPEKQSQEDALNEVSAQSPSQIYNGAISAGGAIKTKYVQNTSLLAGLASDNPLGGGSSGGGAAGSSQASTQTPQPPAPTANDNNTPGAAAAV